MKLIFKNFVYLFKRFKASSVLNIMGLSVAFAVFIVIMMQLHYDFMYNKQIKNGSCIFRVEMSQDNGKYAILSAEFANVLIASSPHILAGSYALSDPSDFFFTVDRGNNKASFLEQVIHVEHTYSKVFKFAMAEGSDSCLNIPKTVLIPQSLSKKFFGNEYAIGKTLQTRDGDYTVGGVYKDFPKNTSVDNLIYAPMSEIEMKYMGWNNQNFVTYLRLDSPAASSEVIADVKKSFPGNEYVSWKKNDLQLTSLSDLHYTTDVKFDEIPKANKQTLLMLFAIAVAIIVIACVNYVNFSISLIPLRIKSINTQAVLGASRTHLRVAFLVEAIFITTLAFLCSLALVYFASTTSISQLVNADIHPYNYPTIIAFTFVLSLLTGILSGTYPAYYATSFSPAFVLRGRFGMTLKGRHLRNMLIGIQFISAFILIIGAGCMLSQKHYLHTAPIGYDRDALVIVDINPQINKERKVFTKKLMEYPEIAGVTYSWALISGSDLQMSWGKSYKGKDIQFVAITVDPSFLDVMGINTTEGRKFREDDDERKYGAYIFNEKARKDFGLDLNSDIDSTLIVGFVPNIKYASFRKLVEPMAFIVYKGLNIQNRYAYIKLKKGSNYHLAMEHIKESLTGMDAGYPFNIRFFDDTLNKLYENEQRASSQITMFGLIAIIISLMGVFGVVMLENEQRQKETSIRKVLGSSVMEILTLFNRSYLRLLLITFVIAAPIAYYGVSQWLDNFVYKTPIHWWIFFMGFVLVALLTIIIVVSQSWKAATSNPVNALKNE